MTNTKNTIIKSGILAVLLILQWPVLSCAELNLSVLPADGGNALRFGRVESFSAVDQEVRVRVDSDQSGQYQIYQRLVDQLTNERGEILPPNVLWAGGMVSSNTRGSLYLQSPERVGYGEQLVYTSDANGTADSFILLYRVDTSTLTSSGTFLGRMMYRVRPVGGGAESQVILPLSMESQGGLNLETRGSSGNDRAVVDSQNLGPGIGAYFQIAFSNNVSGGTIRIYQDVNDLPHGEMMEYLEPGLLTFTASGGVNGELRAAGMQELERGRELIYEGNAAADDVQVNFSLDQNLISGQNTGTYRGVVRYIIDADGSTQTFDLNLEVRINPVFELSVIYPPEGMRFQDLLPDDPPQLREVEITVKTNLGKPYTVNQSAMAPLMSDEGSAFAQDFFTFKEEAVRGEGRLFNLEFAPVSTGEVPLYVSDGGGEAATFRVIYRIRPYQDMMPGSYRVGMVYSLNEN